MPVSDARLHRRLTLEWYARDCKCALDDARTKGNELLTALVEADLNRTLDSLRRIYESGEDDG